MSLVNRSEAVRSAMTDGSIGTLAELQQRLSLGMINSEPPDVPIGTTAFCTFRSFDTRSYGLYMWVSLQDKDKDLGGNIRYHVQVEGEDKIWVDAKYVWTKEQVERLTGRPAPTPYIAPWDRHFTLPEGVQIKDPQAFIQAALNMMRDAEVFGRAGSTNLHSVKCDVKGLCLGHFYKLGDALGPEACDALNVQKLNNA